MISEINAKRIKAGVLKPVQHYLTHIAYMIEQQGSMRAYSARSMERTIGRYKKTIRAKTNAGANAANILQRFATFNFIDNLPWQAEEEVQLITARPYGDHSFLNNPSGDEEDPQLWQPFQQAETNHLPFDVPQSKFLVALDNCYKRIFNRPTSVASSTITIADRCWAYNKVYSSESYQQYISSKKEKQFVMFTVNYIA